MCFNSEWMSSSSEVQLSSGMLTSEYMIASFDHRYQPSVLQTCLGSHCTECHD